MGFGHRVYKNYDPRAKILKKAVDKVIRKGEHPRPVPGHRTEARGGRVGGPLFHRAQSSTRMSTSTPGSYCGRWVFR